MILVINKLIFKYIGNNIYYAERYFSRCKGKSRKTIDFKN